MTHLYVDRWGAGPPVLLLHGLGASSRYWERVRGAGSGYTAIAPDLLGFGRSPSPDDSTYSVHAHLAALLEVVTEPVVVVGHSMGAILAAALAARRPEVVRGVVLVGLPAFPDEATARSEIGRLGKLARWTVDGRPIARAVCTAMCRLRPLAVAMAPIIVRDLPRHIASDGARHTWPSYSRSLHRVIVEHRVLPDLLASRCRVVALHGDADRQAPPIHLQELADRCRAGGKQLDLRLVADDHHLAVHRPELVARTIAAMPD